MPYNDKLTLKPGEQSPLKKIMKVDDMWIYHTHGQIDVQFKNKNVAPKVPTYKQEKPLDPTKLTPPTPEPMKEAVTKKVVVKGEAEKVHLSALVCPVRLAKPTVLPNTSVDLDNKNTYGLMALGTVGVLALGGTIVHVKHTKGKEQ